MTTATPPATPPVAVPPLLSATGLTRHYPLRRAVFGRMAGVGAGNTGAGARGVRAVDGVDLAIHPGETVALVGESGCGKSTVARCLTLLEPATSGDLRFRGEPVGSRRVQRALRRSVQLVFQDPVGSLNPRLTIGSILAEPLVIHRIGNRAGRRDRVEALLAAVGLAPADAARYPHAFSGGQRQRIAIARALALDPALIVADEPLSALDVSIQSQILTLLADLKQQRGLAYLFISHDLAVVDQVADRVAVMYLGRIVEQAPRRSLFGDPRHPYTRALMAAVPSLGTGKRVPGRVLRGEPADPAAPPAGCAFHPRCPLARDRCRVERPTLEPAGQGLAGQGLAESGVDHQAACHFRDSTGSPLAIGHQPAGPGAAGGGQ